MNALRVFILTLALLAPGTLPIFCGGSCGEASVCPVPASASNDSDAASEPAHSCCSFAPVTAPGEVPSRSPLAPRTPASCCCVQAPIDTPRTTPTAPQTTPSDDLPVAELPKPWTPRAAFDDTLIRGLPSPARAVWRPGGGNPIQAVLCIWRN